MRPVLPTIFAALTLVSALALALSAVAAVPLSAQLQVPRVPGVDRGLRDVSGQIADTTAAADQILAREAQRLLRVRNQTLNRLLRRHSDAIERDAGGDLARNGELIAIAPTAAQLAILEKTGFRVLAREDIAGLDIAVVRLGLPLGMTLAKAQRRAAQLVPDLEISADHLHFTAGQPASTMARSALPMALAAQRGPVVAVPIGVIDGAPAGRIAVTATKGFARGAPTASDHGSAVASLLLATGARHVRVADVYGSDPAGGNALAIAKAMGWLVESGSKVVSVSLVGPRSPLVERAVAAARIRGVIVVAAVGNDGPAAPPAYPASYPGVVAITGVDRKGRALIEAGRALHVDYAAPGAQVFASDAAGQIKAWRGTSFAAPLAAARVASATSAQSGDWRTLLDTEARDLGKKGPDEVFGRGLLCGGCGVKK